jgi:predicted outer membrane repeat protein
VISRDLTLQGSGTLDGGGTGTVLTVSDGVFGEGPIATVIDLTITNGGGGTLTGLICGGRLTGGGIFNAGDLTLGGAATVTANTAQCAGGIFVDAGGVLTMNGSAAVSHNSPDGIVENFFGNVTLNGSSAVDSNTGLGIVAYSSVTMNDSSTVSNNSDRGIYDRSVVVMNGRSSVTGNGNGGIYIEIGRSLTMNGYSSITGNTATFGGGILSPSAYIVLNDRASVSDNTATRGGGGIYNTGPITLNDWASVNGNTAGTSAAAGYGGGVWSQTPAVYVNLNDHSFVKGNDAIGPGADGGGFYTCGLVGVQEPQVTLNGGKVKANKPNDLVYEEVCAVFA